MITPQEIEAWRTRNRGRICLYRPTPGLPTLGVAVINSRLFVLVGLSPREIASELIELQRRYPEDFSSPIDRLLNEVPEGYFFQGRREVRYGDWDINESYLDKTRKIIVPEPLDRVSWDILLEDIRKELGCKDYSIVAA